MTSEKKILKGDITAVHKDLHRENLIHISVLIREGNIYDFVDIDPISHTLKPALKLTVESNDE